MLLLYLFHRMFSLCVINRCVKLWKVCMMTKTCEFFTIKFPNIRDIMRASQEAPLALRPKISGSYVIRLQRPCVYPALFTGGGFADSCLKTQTAVQQQTSKMLRILADRKVRLIVTGLPMLHKHRARQHFHAWQLSLV